MAELDKKKSYSIDMTIETKAKLSKFAKQLTLPQGDALAYLLKEYGSLNQQLVEAHDNQALLQTIVGQQNMLIKLLKEQSALLQLVAKGQ